MIVASMATQHAKWLDMCFALPWRAPVASLNVMLTSTCWRNDHNGFSHQGPGFMDTVISKKGSVARVYLPPDANTLLSVAEHCLASRNYVNLIVIDKQPQLQWLTLPEARAHCARGASIWEWAGTPGDPDVVLTQIKGPPRLLRSIAAPAEHPHGIDDEKFEALFTRDRDVVFAFHGYPNVVHALLHGRFDARRFHVRGYMEEGTTTTPFDMVVLNGISRFHVCLEALRRARRTPPEAAALAQECEEMLAKHRAYIREHFQDLPEIRNWTLTP